MYYIDIRKNVTLYQKLYFSFFVYLLVLKLYKLNIYYIDYKNKEGQKWEL